MLENNEIEAKLLGEEVYNNYEKEIHKQIEEEILKAKKEREKENNRDEYSVIITDIGQVPAEKRFSKDSIYKVFNRKQKTESFVNGEQAENLLKYTDNYVVKFDHRVEYK